MTPAERARLIEKQEFEAESQAARKRALLLIEQRRRQNEARVDAWIHGKQVPTGNVKCVKRSRAKARTYTYNGETKDLREWAAQCGVPIQIMRNRINSRGLEGAINFTPTCRKAKVHVVGGVAKTLAEWAAHIGISYNTLVKRMRKGCTLAEALAMPKYNSAKRQGAGVVADFPPVRETGAWGSSCPIPNITFEDKPE